MKSLESQYENEINDLKHDVRLLTKAARELSSVTREYVAEGLPRVDAAIAKLQFTLDSLSYSPDS